MLRDQRLSLMDTDFHDKITIDRLYFESMNAFADVYTESSDNVVSKAITKLKTFIEKIIKAIKDFFNSFNKKETVVNPNAQVEEKELGKLEKFIKTCKKVIGIPIKKLAHMISAHKKGLAAGAIIAAISAFSIGALVTTVKNTSIKNTNKKIQGYNMRAKDKRDIAEQVIKKLGPQEDRMKADLSGIEKELETIHRLVDNNPSMIVPTGRTRQLGKQGRQLKRDPYALQTARQDKEDYSVEMPEIPLIQNFYTMLAGKLNQAANALQSGLLKMRRPVKTN